MSDQTTKLQSLIAEIVWITSLVCSHLSTSCKTMKYRYHDIANSCIAHVLVTFVHEIGIEKWIGYRMIRMSVMTYMIYKSRLYGQAWNLSRLWSIILRVWADGSHVFDLKTRPGAFRVDITGVHEISIDKKYCLWCNRWAYDRAIILQNFYPGQLKHTEQRGEYFPNSPFATQSSYSNVKVCVNTAQNSLDIWL